MADNNLKKQQDDSIKREKIFQAMGDTIYGKLLYGMSRDQAMSTIAKFVMLNKSQFYSEGFDFAGIHFMDLSDPVFFSDIENTKFIEKNSFQSLEGNLFWEGGLCSTNWTSYPLHSDNTKDVEDLLTKLVECLKKRYGECNEEKINHSNWFFITTHNNKAQAFFVDRPIALWETSERIVTISIHGENWPKEKGELSINENGGYFGNFDYRIKVRFYNKNVEYEIDTFIKESVEKKECRNY